MNRTLIFFMLALVALAAVPYIQLDAEKIQLDAERIQFETGGGGGLDIPDLVAHYKFNDSAATTNVADSTGNHPAGSSSNTSVIAATGKIGGAFAFTNGVFVTIPNHANLLSSGNASYLVWIRTSSAESEQAIVTAGGRMLLHLYLQKVYSSAISGKDIHGVTTVCDGNWRHVAFIDRSTGWELWVDGVKDKTSVRTGITNEGQPVRIGFKLINGIKYFYGLMDDVRCYNRALTTNEIAAIYNGGDGTEDE